jgi:hypothetical protein
MSYGLCHVNLQPGGKMVTIDQLVPIREWAEAHGFSQDYVRAMCRQGKVKAVRLGYNWYIIKDEGESSGK